MSFFRRRRRRLLAQLLGAVVVLSLSVQPCLAVPGWVVQANDYHGIAPDTCCSHSALPDRHIGKPPAALLAGKTPTPASMAVASTRLPWTAEDSYSPPAVGHTPALPLALYLRLERLLI